MTNDENPIACSLEGVELRRRLEVIATLGADALLGREDTGGRHLLRFRNDAGVRQQLEEIVAAEAECCSFLKLALSEGGEELALSIAAPPDGQAVADGLAGAFEADTPA